jgi:hypothetical protein
MEPQSSIPCSQDPACAPYPLTPWSIALLDKLTVAQLVEFPAFYGTQKFITVLTRARHWPLTSDSMEQSTFWQANSRSASPEIPRLLWNHKIHKGPPVVPIDASRGKEDWWKKSEQATCLLRDVHKKRQHNAMWSYSFVTGFITLCALPPPPATRSLSRYSTCSWILACSSIPSRSWELFAKRLPELVHENRKRNTNSSFISVSYCRQQLLISALCGRQDGADRVNEDMMIYRPIHLYDFAFSFTIEVWNHNSGYFGLGAALGSREILQQFAWKCLCSVNGTLRALL